MKEWSVLFLFVATGLLIVFMISAIGADIENRKWRNELIRRGHAEYNQKTGAWQWKEQRQ